MKILNTSLTNINKTTLCWRNQELMNEMKHREEVAKGRRKLKRLLDIFSLEMVPLTFSLFSSCMNLIKPKSTLSSLHAFVFTDYMASWKP